MINDAVRLNNYAVDFADNMSGGAFICKTAGDHELLYVNKRLVEIFECESTEEFMDFVGGTLKGFFNVTQYDVVFNDAKSQFWNRNVSSGHLFFNIKTRKGRVIEIVNHWKFVKNKDSDNLIYGMIFNYEPEDIVEDFDPVTGLFGKKRLNHYIDNERSSMVNGSKYTVVYLNIVNFKLLNIENGAAEGDKCLKILSDVLVRCFKDYYLARLSDDHFAVFGKYEDVVIRAQATEKEFTDIYGKYFNVFLKFGIYEFEYGDDFDAEDALSRAKVACDYIKRDINSNIVEYSDEIVENIKTREYIIRNLDTAIEKEWIKVYFQPVIRSLTGTLCGMESLVRWIDPEIGFLPPDRFISVLENERIIHKLDSYVVERVCKYIKERVNAGLAVVPVSVNFSQMDFLMCDMIEVVNKLTEEYDIPHDYIHIEITESMIAADEAMMHRIIDGFKKYGFEIWMDDFGSGYSSLTVLKDFRFDTLKLDMKFLSPFTEKSMSIIRSVVTMAKNINMKTLAEGVETKEQLDFLKEIGCGMIQGYYYGKPEPIEKVFEHIFEKNITIEARKWRHFYETAGFNVIYTDSPLEIIEDDGKDFKTLYMNESYRNQIFDSQLSLEEIDERIYHSASPLVGKYREFANMIEKSGQQETFYYTSNGMYLQFTGQVLAECDGHYIIKGSIVNLNIDERQRDSDRLDKKARQLNLLFETVLLVNIRNNSVVPLFGGYKYFKSGTANRNDLQRSIKMIESEIVHPAEREKCHAFLLLSNFKERVESTGKGFINDTFRVKQSDGSFQWKEFFIMMIPGTLGNEYLCCMKNYTPNAAALQRDDHTDKKAEKQTPDDTAQKNDLQKIHENVVYDSVSLWNNLIWNSNLKIFWKDKDLRFVGASRAFLDYLGFGSINDILGKNSEELNLHVKNDLLRENEEDVIKKGTILRNVFGNIIIKNIVRDVVYDEIPLYDGDNIVGLLGNFRVNADELSLLGAYRGDARMDPVTGLFNAHGFLDCLIDYASNYHENDQDYGIVLINNRKFSRIIDTYGKEFSEKVLRKMAERIKDTTVENCFIARPKDSIFALITAVIDKDSFNDLVSIIEENLKSINEVDGNSITMKLNIVSKIRSVENLTDEVFYVRALREVT